MQRKSWISLALALALVPGCGGIANDTTGGDGDGDDPPRPRPGSDGDDEEAAPTTCRLGASRSCPAQLNGQPCSGTQTCEEGGWGVCLCPQTGSGGAPATGGVGGTIGVGFGGEVPEPSCDNIVGCGGDVTGVWFVADNCLTVNGVVNLLSFGLGCAEGPVVGALSVSGQLIIDPEIGVVTDMTRTAGTVHVTIPPQCRDVGAFSCSDLAAPMRSLGFAEPTTCADSTSENGACECTATVDQPTVPAFLTPDGSEVAGYTTAGTTLTLAGNIDVDYTYCVDGDLMHLSPMSLGDTGTVTGSIVFQKAP